MGPLAGVRVIEFAHIMAGPTCGLMLADLGADVIKVERIGAGDDTRRSVPPAVDGESAAFMMMNRNKRGLAVDLKAEAGREIARRLIAGADVVIENFRKGAMERLGLGYEAMREVNPGIVYCEISGFGRTGPYAERGGFDLIAQGMSGVMSITGEGPGRPPVKVGGPITDITAGILAAMGILAAYARRLKTGHGQRVDTSLFEAGIVHTYWQSAIAFATGVAPGPMGSAHPLNAPYQALQTADGWITIGAANQANWLKLLDAIEHPQLIDDLRFADNDARMRNLDALVAVVEPVFRARSTQDWLARLETAGVPAGPILDVIQMHDDPQTRARGMVQTVRHTRVGEVQTIGCPVKFSDTPAEITRGAPLLGEHGREVLSEIGYGEEEIDRFVADGVVGVPGWSL
jgi:crotonobetainyl-CoA:carnitine CoA-transferase CaiB-like acyl-CoA transferase